VIVNSFKKAAMLFLMSLNFLIRTERQETYNRILDLATTHLLCDFHSVSSGFSFGTDQRPQL